MASSEEDTTDSDLIDFDVGSPEIPTSPVALSMPEIESDNLLDSELPILEQKLQTTKDLPITNFACNTVDVEDILITIDDDVIPSTSTNCEYKPLERSHSEMLLDLCLPIENIRRSMSCDNLEALSVLMQLDEVLNDSLTECSFSEDSLDAPDNKDVMDEQSIEACLLDLDNYLRAFDTSDDSVKEFVVGRSERSSLASLPEASNLAKNESNLSADDVNNRISEHLLELPLRCEDTCANYVNESCDNSGPSNKLYKSESLRFPRLLFKGDDALRRHHPLRATVAVVEPRVRRPVSRQLLVRNFPSGRTSWTAGDSDESIDWSWVQDVSHEVNKERHVHAAGDCCTGTVSVEPHRLEAGGSTQEEMEGKDDTRGSWLRTSMRRVRHFRLPSDSTPSEAENAASAALAMDVPADVQTLQVPVITTVRPVSAPSRLPDRSSARERSRSSESRRSVVSHVPGGRARSSSASSRSRRHRSLSSSESSLASSVDSTPSCTSAPTPTINNQQQTANSTTRRSCERTRSSDMPEAESPLGQWPHGLSSMLACLGCSLGLFNICRFAILSIHFGANFISQFFLLSLFIGLPLFTLQLCLGQQLGAGVIDMWRISPLFQGVGVSLLVSQALIGLYSITGISWMFVYFRDSFITKMDRYRWAEPFAYYRKDIPPPINGSFKLTETVPDYLSGIVFQRTHLVSGSVYGTIKFQPAFNLAVVWMIVFVSLSKGLRSYGKVIYVFTLLPVFGTFVLCAKILGMMQPDTMNAVFPETTWSEFFTNSRSWLAASQEVFLTWGLLGAAVMQIASHNKHKHLLQRDSSLVAVITLSILMLMAFLANTCVQILRSYGYTYQPDSFENISMYMFMRHVKDPLPPSLASTPVRYMVHSSLIVGEKVVRPGMDYSSESGYQVLRLATELVPATFAVLGSDQISPFWAVLFYFILILFGIAQQLAIWHCVITGIMAIKAKVLKSWETTITFFSCACGFILGLPMTTELGIYVVYFLDVTVGGLWWLILVYLLQILAVFMVRGRPYSGDTIVTALFTNSKYPCVLSWAPALLSFTWNVILPVVLMVFCIGFFKNGNFRELFIWHHAPSIEYWPLWARQIGSMIQLLPVLCIPVVAVIQSYRYLNNGPPDILERIQLLYRPPLGEHMDDLAIQEAAAAAVNANTTPVSNIPPEDPPPKYTPPPSYTTATGARIAKLFRQSIRRSIRRLANVLGESSSSRQRAETQPPPPDYNAVLVEMNQSGATGADQVNISVTDSSNLGNRSTTLQRELRAASNNSACGLTAADVASILRSSFRRSTIRLAGTLRRTAASESNNASLSAENLVDSAAPIGETSLVLERLSRAENGTDNKSVNNELSSVI